MKVAEKTNEYLDIFITKTLLEMKGFQIFCVPEHP